MSEIQKRLWGMKYELNPPKPLEAGYGCLMEIAAQATDLADKAIVDCIVQTAKEAGITDLYLLDKNFIRLAIMSAIEDTQNYKASFEQVAEKYSKIQDKMLNGDLVEVVRCKDCKHWSYAQSINRHECNIFNGAYDWIGYPTKEKDFCSYGERKEEKHEQTD